MRESKQAVVKHAVAPTLKAHADVPVVENVSLGDIAQGDVRQAEAQLT